MSDGQATVYVLDMDAELAALEDELARALAEVRERRREQENPTG